MISRPPALFQDPKLVLPMPEIREEKEEKIEPKTEPPISRKEFQFTANNDLEIFRFIPDAASPRQKSALFSSTLLDGRLERQAANSLRQSAMMSTFPMRQSAASTGPLNRRSALMNDRLSHLAAQKPSAWLKTLGGLFCCSDKR